MQPRPRCYLWSGAAQEVTLNFLLQKMTGCCLKLCDLLFAIATLHIHLVTGAHCLEFLPEGLVDFFEGRVYFS